MKLPTVLVAGIAALTAWTPLGAQEDSLDEIVITASRVEMPVRELGASVSVLEEDDIEANGALSLAEVLRSLPGVGVSNSGGLGQPTTLRIRGEEGYRTLIRIDGMDIADPTTPQPSPRLTHVPSSGVSRVEVLRGPQGLIYGADAGGVVNISTRHGYKQFSGNVNVEQGRYNTQSLALDLGDSVDQLDYFVSATDIGSDGFNARPSDAPPADDDGYDNRTLHGRVGYQLSDAWRVESVLRETEARTEFDGCFVPSDRCHADFDQQSGRVALNYSGETHSHRLSWQRSDVERSSYADGVLSFATDGWIERIDYVGSWSLNNANQFVYGLEQKTEANESPGQVDQERDQVGYFVEWQSEIASRLFITAGARRDDNDDFGEHTSGRITGAYLIPTNGDGVYKLKASYGTGFRAPSLYEVAYNAGPFAFPPASLTELKEETSAGYDAGVEYYGASLQWQAVYFSQTVDDRIFFDPGFSGYLQESGEAESSGVELSVQLALSEQFSLRTNYTYTDAETVGGSSRVRRPEHLYNVAVRWHGLDDKLKIFSALRGARDAIDIGDVELDDYTVVDINVRYQWLDWLEFYARVENAFDEEYQEVVDYNTSGRAAYGGARFSF